MTTRKKRPVVTAQDIEVAVSGYFGRQKKAVIPNVSYGLGLHHEADLLAVNRRRILEEIEIKVTLSDIRAEANKSHGHRHPLIAALWFAIPDFLVESGTALIPEHAGILSYNTNPTAWVRIRTIRVAKRNRQTPPLSDAKYVKLLELGCLRIWSLKAHLAQIRRDAVCKANLNSGNPEGST